MTTIVLNLNRSVITNRLQSGAGNESVLVNGQDFVITGTGFGTKVGYSEHLNTSGILSLVDGSNFGVVGRWDGSNYTGVSNRPVVISEGINGKCLKFTKPAAGTPNCAIALNYDVPVPVNNKIYSSRYVKHMTNAVTGGQWKYERYLKVPSVVDKAYEAYWNASSATPDNKFQIRSSTFPTESVVFADSTVSKMPHNKNKWVRMDTLITLPVDFATPDSFKLESWVHDPDGVSLPLYKNFTSNQAVLHINPYDLAGSEWTQHLFQNYFGNGDYGSSDHTLWMDKIFESVGDQLRVEVCNNVDYTLATKFFSQPIVSWSDTSIVIKADTGNLSPDVRWVHVINNAGTSIFHMQA